MILISIFIVYLTIMNANSKEAKIINEMQIKYPNSVRYIG